MNEKSMLKMKKSVLISIPVLFIISGPMHFLFELLGEAPIIGAIVPVSESPWEHLKLVFYPILFWWLIFYARGRKQEDFSKEKWIAAAFAAVLSAVLTIFFIFYSYTGAFAVEFLAFDIFSSLFATAVGQCLAYHIFKYSKPTKPAAVIAFLGVAVLLVMFVAFTYNTPHVPLFLDRNTGGYGI
ncbi:DUF6512 family protein [Clostridium swellfunianum]|uniref:DUF6512 family protein n=1 Tax=Clostridium swellfunianum TaxID=1367462 RepID=UPI00202F0490|nr:DUF6512 family protein [Clostridium swellfunianum]